MALAVLPVKQILHRIGTNAKLHKIDSAGHGIPPSWAHHPKPVDGRDKAPGHSRRTVTPWSGYMRHVAGENSAPRQGARPF
ncbi:hypothetical protein GCM10011345_28960 [Gemmobacter megaterium]|nr:hypothetical protein GCM10011345_28960 [Gemmobacter megaterium]